MIDLYKQKFMRVLFAAALVAGGANALAQTSATQKKADSTFDTSPRFEIGLFGGGQFWKLRQAHNPVPDKLVNGGIWGFRFTYDAFNYAGVELAVEPRGVNNLRLQPFAGTPGETIAFGARNMQASVSGVVYLTPRSSRVRPFLTVGPGFQYFFPTRDAKGQAGSIRYARYAAGQLEGRDAPALTWGGGVKFNFNPRFLVRIDYHGTWTEHPHFNITGAPGAPGSVYIPKGGSEIGSQVTLGLAFRFHRPEAPPVAPAAPPPPPPPPPEMKNMTVNVAASAHEVCPGEVVTVTASTNLPQGAEGTYQWSVNGEPVNQAKTFEFGTSGRAAGSYTIAVNIQSSGYNAGTGSTSVTVRQYRAPSGTVEVQPKEIYVGEKSTLTGEFSGQCGGQISPATFSASEGTVSGNMYDSSGVQFAPGATTEQQKTITITATAKDDKGSGSATNTIIVKKKAANAVRLPDLVFARNSARVNNCGKRLLLEQLKTYLDQDPTGKVVFVGHIATNEPKSAHLDRRRAENAAAVISAGKGICLGFAPSQILISEAGTSQEGAEFQPFFCGTSATPTQERAGQTVRSTDKTAQERRVEVWFVPTGGVMPASVKEYKDATAYEVSKLGCPK